MQYFLLKRNKKSGSPNANEVAETDAERIFSSYGAGIKDFEASENGREYRIYSSNVAANQVGSLRQDLGHVGFDLKGPFNAKTIKNVWKQ